jgi:hypothetical protein
VGGIANLLMLRSSLVYILISLYDWMSAFGSVHSMSFFFIPPRSFGF